MRMYLPQKVVILIQSRLFLSREILPTLLKFNVMIQQVYDQHRTQKGGCDVELISNDMSSKISELFDGASFRSDILKAHIINKS